jgi:CheY-like chemotaxis protein
MAEQRRRLPYAGEEIELAADAPVALVVEDDPDGARIAAGMLRMLGYKSRVVHDANAALMALAREGPPSLMLLDVCLPAMDGVGLAKVALRIQGMESVPIVAASAVYPSDGPVSRVMAGIGVTAYLAKPFTLNGLRAAIDEARSQAMRRGPPPVPSMSEGMPSITDADLANHEAVGTREAEQDDDSSLSSSSFEDLFASLPPAPPPRAAPASPARLPTDDAPKRPAAAPPPRQSGRMAAVFRGDTSLDFPIQNTGEQDVPEEIDEASMKAAEIYGQATIGRQRLMVVIERCGKSSMTIRSPDEEVAPEAMVRLEIVHRRPIQDAMTDVTIRALGHVSRVEETATAGWLCTLRINAARPADAYDDLIDWFERFGR